MATLVFKMRCSHPVSTLSASPRPGSGRPSPEAAVPRLEPRPSVPRAGGRVGAAAAGRRAALPGGAREGPLRRGAVPAQEEDGRGEVRGVLAAAGGVPGRARAVVGPRHRALTGAEISRGRAFRSASS